MNPSLILTVTGLYFLMLLTIGWITGRKAGNKMFFIGNRQSHWFLVDFGMIGAYSSAVTFISIPGWVETSAFSYLQMVLGYMAGYLVIALILMPVYYRLRLTSIYTYLDDRFGRYSYKTGAFFFLISRVIGASFRLYLVAGVLQLFVFGPWHVPFAITVLITILLIWVYTFRGGIRTIVWTDTLQTFFMLLAMVLTIVLITRDMNMGLGGLFDQIRNSPYSQVFFWDWRDSRFFWKQFISGAFIAIVMTGLDQDMMQKNLSIQKLKLAQRNIYWQMGMHMVVNVLFLSLGALLYLFAIHKYQELTGMGLTLENHMFPNEALHELAAKAGLDTRNPDARFPTDYLYPMLALKYLSPVVGLLFVVGLIAAAYSSADSALTALTTSFCVDFLGMNENSEKIRTRFLVHIGFSVLLLFTILIFREIGNRAVIDQLFRAAGYTYGPLLGLYAFGIFTKRKLRDTLVPVICLAAPGLTYLFYYYSAEIFQWICQVAGWNYDQTLKGYSIGYELLILNGMITFIGLLMISSSRQKKIKVNG